MSKKVTLGGDRLGTGNKNKVELQGFERSTHDLSNAWRSTMSAGTLVPFMCHPALPGDVWEIKLNADAMTHPTTGPLFGSYKVQLDVFSIPMRLYNSWVHNNKLGIGLHMQDIKMPVVELGAWKESDTSFTPVKYPISTSHILKYLGLSGVGINNRTDQDYITRKFNGIPLLGYWDIFKNYYANKQEENAYVISTPVTILTPLTSIGSFSTGTYVPITTTAVPIVAGSDLVDIFQLPTDPDMATWDLPLLMEQTFYKDGTLNLGTISDIGVGEIVYARPPYLRKDKIYVTREFVGATHYIRITFTPSTTATLDGWEQNTEISYRRPPQLYPFPLTDIDSIREEIMYTPGNSEFNINTHTYDVPNTLVKLTLPEVADSTQNVAQLRYNQEGLLVKTYQSDIFNAWLNTETIDGVGGINELTRVSTVGDYFTIDTLQLAYKVYRMLNQITVSGGTIDDWQTAVYDHDRFAAPEIPMYEGGLSKELVFQEIYSSNATENQPLGTLAGKGGMSSKHKGGHVVIHTNELSFIMGIISLTPRIDYSQGNEWWTSTMTWNDWHKPHLDQIGFQDLLAEQMAWFGVGQLGTTDTWVRPAVGKQPAWINYMTNYNKCYGNFADEDNEMFMTLNRRYERNDQDQLNIAPIKDATTYIDPTKFNFIFAQTSLDAMNFWVQVAQDTTVRRKMSAKVMPNL